MSEIVYSHLRRVEYSTDSGDWAYRTRFRGWFHRWGERLDPIDHDDLPSRSAAEVVAIVEADDGQVYEVPADRIRFLD